MGGGEWTPQRANATPPHFTRAVDLIVPNEPDCEIYVFLLRLIGMDSALVSR